MMKVARLAVVNDVEGKDKLVSEACRELDRMVTKGVVHKKTASRKKSRLIRALHGKIKLDTVP